MATLSSLPDSILLAVNGYFSDPKDTARLSATCKDFRDVLPGQPPLRFRIVGCRDDRLSLPYDGNRYIIFYASPILEGRDDPSHVALGANDRLTFATHYYFWTVAGTTRVYLGRNQRFDTDTPATGPHFSYRYNLGLLDWNFGRLQTWTVSHCVNHHEDGDVVPMNDVHLGLSVGGRNLNLQAPDNNNRRVLTSRTNDWNVVVSWFGSDEYTRLVLV